MEEEGSQEIRGLRVRVCMIGVRKRERVVYISRGIVREWWGSGEEWERLVAKRKRNKGGE